MVTVDYSEVLGGVCDLIGIGFDELLTVEASKIRRFLNKRLRTAWEHRFWPDTVLTEERWFRPKYDAATSYSQLAEVFDVLTGKYWIRADNTGATFTPGAGTEWVEARSSYSGDDFEAGTVYQAGTTLRYPLDGFFYYVWKTTSGAELPSDAGYFVVLEPFLQYVNKSEAGQSEIGLVRACTDRDPRIFRNAAEVEYFLGVDQLIVLDRLSSVWIEFQRPAPMLIGADWSAASTYAAGDRVYFSNNFYLALASAGAGESPATHAAKWQKQEIPVEFQRYLEQGAYADWLPSDGQNDRRRFEAGLAEDYLAQAVIRLTGTQSQNNRTRVLQR